MSAKLGFSHIGIYVASMEAMRRFYTEVLGFTITDVGTLSVPTGQVDLVFMSRDPKEHHQIVLASGRPADLSFNVINQISLRAENLGALKQFVAQLEAAGATDIQPVTHGNAVSVYARDPEGNRIELFIDTPWYVSQPMRVPVDLSLSDDALMAHIEAHARALPGFEARADWEARMAKKMGLV